MISQISVPCEHGSKARNGEFNNPLLHENGASRADHGNAGITSPSEPDEKLRILTINTVRTLSLPLLKNPVPCSLKSVPPAVEPLR